MAYEYEIGEWRRATYAMSEMDRAATEHSTRASIGMCGDPSDAYEEGR